VVSERLVTIIELHLLATGVLLTYIPDSDDKGLNDLGVK